MKKNIIVIVALLSLFLTACFSDKGNYSYKEVNELLVDGKLHKYVVVSGEEVVLEPKITFQRKSGNDNKPIPELSYEWIYNNKLMSTDKNCTYKAIDKLGIHTWILKVRNIATGEQYSGYFFVDIQSPYKTGYVILHEKDNASGELSFIRTLRNRVRIDYVNYDTLLYTNEYANIYESINGAPMLKNPVSITEHSPYDSYDYGLSTALTIVSDNGNYIEDLNGESFVRETKLQNEFVDDILPNDFSPKQVVDTPWDSYLIAKNGLMYTKRSSSLSLLYTVRYNAKFTYNNDTKYSDIVSTYYKRASNLIAIEYDKDGKRNYVGIVCELNKRPKNNGLRLPLIAGDDPELLKHFQDVKYEILASDYLQHGYDSDDVLAQSLLVKENGKYFLHVMVLSYNSLSSLSVNGSVKIDLGAINGGKPVLGMSTSKVKDHIMFYDENTIYVYDWSTKSVSILFTSVKKISAVGFYSRIIDYYNYEDAGHPAVDPSFAVGYETGEVEIYELAKPSLKTVHKKVYTSKNNFGKIKQIIYKLGESGDFFERI